MFDNVESKLKTVAKVNFVSGIIMAFICLIAAISNELLRTAFIVLTAVMIVSGLIGSWLIYGFAEIIECVKEIRKLASATDFGTVQESDKLKLKHEKEVRQRELEAQRRREQQEQERVKNHESMLIGQLTWTRKKSYWQKRPRLSEYIIMLRISMPKQWTRSKR